MIKFDIKASFIAEVSRMVEEDGLSLLEATIEYCETRGIEVEMAAEIIAGQEVLKSKLQLEAEDLNFMKKTTRLPI